MNPSNLNESILDRSNDQHHTVGNPIQGHAYPGAPGAASPTQGERKGRIGSSALEVVTTNVRTASVEHDYEALSNNSEHHPHLHNRHERQSRFSYEGALDKKKLLALAEESLALVDSDELDREDGFKRKEPLGPQMYQWHYIGLYAHYAAVGLSGGVQGLAPNFCYYFYKGANNVCANAGSMIFIPWGFKIFYAIACDSFRPFGMRRKPYMIAGWAGVLICMLVLAIFANKFEAQSWIAISLVTQAFLMLADVPADGYSVELGQLEKEDERGQILATGQRIRFIVGCFAGFVQAFMVNSRQTNKVPCSISFSECWGWGLTPSGYYALVFCLLFVLCIPIFYLKEPSSRNIPLRDFHHHRLELWETLKNPTSLFLLIFVVGNGIFSNMSPITQTYMQYSIIGLTNFQSGIMTILTNFATVGGILCFQRYFINWNWRYTQYISTTFTTFLGLLWLLVYYDIGGTMTSWFTIFLQLNVALSMGLAQVLYAMSVIELAKKGQESTTYELIVSAGNSSNIISSIIATQLLTAVHSNTCSDPSGVCPDGLVNTYSMSTFFSTDGPAKFTKYTWMIFGINLAGMLIFTRFLPKQKSQCEEWKQAGNTFVNSSNPFVAIFTPARVGYASAALATMTITYQLVSTIVLLNPKTACLSAFGGSGC